MKCVLKSSDTCPKSGIAKNGVFESYIKKKKTLDSAGAIWLFILSFFHMLSTINFKKDSFYELRLKQKALFGYSIQIRHSNLWQHVRCKRFVFLINRCDDDKRKTIEKSQLSLKCSLQWVLIVKLFYDLFWA